MEDNLKIKMHFNKIANDYDFWKKKNWYYYEQIKDLISAEI